MTHLYISAFLICGGVFRGKGFHSIPVPYSDIPEASEDQWNSGEYESLLVSPPDGWSVIFGCRESGHLGTYGVNDVGEGVLERSNRASFHNETNCFSVKLHCARVDCKAPATLHVNLKDGEAEKDLLRLLKAAFFDGLLPCGHPIMPFQIAIMLICIASCLDFGSRLLGKRGYRCLSRFRTSIAGIVERKFSSHFPPVKKQDNIRPACPRIRGKHTFYALIASKRLSTKPQTSSWSVLFEQRTELYTIH